MATSEKAPRLPSAPDIKRPKGLSRRAVVAGLGATGVLVAAGLYASTRPQETAPVATARPSAAAGDTAKPTTAVTEAPKTATPTEKILTDAEKIDVARKAHQDALSKGEYRIPTSENLINIGGRMDEGKLMPSGEKDLFVVIPPNIDFIFPSPVDGKVAEIGKAGRIISVITIQTIDGKNINLITTGNLMTEVGNTIAMGTPLFNIKYDPESTQQKGFEESGAEVKPKGTVAIIASQNSTGKGFEQLSMDKNLLKDSVGKFITIPTLKK